MSRLSLSLFGILTLQAADGAEIAVSADKVRALLAYLALETGRAHRRETLAGLLWPEHPELKARQSLTQALSVLNSILAPALNQEPSPLTITRLDVALSCEGCSLDVRTFEALLAECRSHEHRPGVPCAECAQRLERALALYRGALLEGFSLRDGPEFDAWLLVVRERLRRQAVEAAATLTRWRESTGGYEAAIASARRWAELDPLDEQAHRNLMRLLAAGGHRSLALAQYETCRQLQRAGLGVEPERATRDLFDHIRAGDPALVRGGEAPVPEVAQPSARASPRHNLPAAVDSFVGRERELSEVQALLSDPVVRLVTLVGAGGMGKTRLALEVARESLDESGGTWFVDLAPLPASVQPGGGPATGPPQGEPLVLRAIANTLGVREDAGVAGLVLALMDRRLLLLLDNCEHVLDGVVPLLATLLRSCPDLRVLATSREPLRVPGEHLYEVAPLAMPALPDVDGGYAGALEFGAMQLLAERASAARYGMVIDESNVRDADAVCRHLDGMPLAIELAAARLSAMDLPELARRLEGALSPGAPDGQRWSLLNSSRGAVHPRQRTLLNTLAWSYGLLDAGERRLFDRLSVFAGSFTLEGARALYTDDDAPDARRVPGLLLALVDRSLVQRLPAGDGAQRYRLLETLRAYAREKLADRDETVQIEAAHIAYYVRLAEEAEPTLRTNDRIVVETMRRLDPEDANLRAAIRRALDRGQVESAMRMATAVEFWIMYHNHLEDYVGYARRALEQEERIPPVLRSKAWDLVGLYDLNWDRVDEYQHASNRQLAAALEAEDERCICRAYGSQALCASMMGDSRGRERLLRQALELAQAAGDEIVSRNAQLLLAYSLPAGEQLEAIERLLPETPQPPDAYAFQQAATVARVNGELGRAERYMRITVDAWHGLDNRVMEGSMSCQLAAIRLLRGAPAQEVLELHTQGEALLRHSGQLRAHLERMGTRGELLCHLNRLPEAEACLQAALARARQLEEIEYLFDNQLRLALVRAERGDVEGARATLAAADGLTVRLDRERQTARFDTRGRVALLAGDAQSAIAPLRAQLDTLRSLAWRAAVAPALEHLAWALAEAGDRDEAATLLAEAQAEREAMGMVLYPVDLPHHERALALVARREQ